MNVHGLVLRRRSKHYLGLAHHCDWVPTLVAAAGGTLNDTTTPAMDGMNLWPALMATNAASTGQCQQSNPLPSTTPKVWRKFIFTCSPRMAMATRENDLAATIKNAPTNNFFFVP